MTKAQCAAIIAAIQATAEYFTKANYQLQNTALSATKGTEIMGDLNDAYDGVIEGIIDDLPDDPEAPADGGADGE